MVDTITPIDHNYHEIRTKRADDWLRSRSLNYIKYRNDWENNPKDHIVGKGPIHLDIEATSNCNLKCTMCPRTDMVNEGTFWTVKNFDLKQFKKIIDCSPDVQSIKFNYLGEPLMNSNLFKMIRYAKRRGIIDTMLNTNATLLTDSKSRMILESGLDKLFFSFDSPTKEDYEKIRVNANFQKTLDKIKRFHEMRKAYGHINPLTRVSMVKMKENEHQWHKFYDLFINIVDIVAYVDYIDHSHKNTTHNTQVDTKFCCPQLWQRMFIHPDGIVTPCCVDSARKMQMGNINENSVEEIWTNYKYENLRQNHIEGKIDEIPVCQNCHLAQL